MALSLVSNAHGEGDGAQRLWDMAACTPDADLAGQIRQHAIDEARHSRAYVTLLGLIFPRQADAELLERLKALSPGLTKKSRVRARKRSPYARPATTDELVQMNLAEMRTRLQHLFQRPVLMKYCPRDRRPRVGRILDSLLLDETRHIAYTARLIERAAPGIGEPALRRLMHRRLRDFNDLTAAEIAAKTPAAA